MSSSTRQMQEWITNKDADRFLAEFLNCGWPSRPRDDTSQLDAAARLAGRSDSAAFDWFARHPRFAPLLPNFPSWDPSWRFETWQAHLRNAWMQKPATRRSSLSQLIQCYLALRAGAQAETLSLIELPSIPSSGIVEAPDGFVMVLYRAIAVADDMRICRWNCDCIRALRKVGLMPRRWGEAPSMTEAEARAYPRKQAEAISRLCGKGCRNYFFVAERNTQRYCSPECAKLSKRAAKLRWWKEHGGEWRRKRKQKAKRSAGKSQRKRKAGK